MDEVAPLTIHGLRHSAISKVYKESIEEMSEYAAMVRAAEFAGHHRPEITKVYTSEQLTVKKNYE